MHFVSNQSLLLSPTNETTKTYGDDNSQKRILKVYSNCDEAGLFLNGKSLGIKKRNSQDFPVAGLRWNLVLDASKWVRFGLTGDGKLIDNQGTSTGSRYVQLYNGRAIILFSTNGGRSVVSAKVEQLPMAFIWLNDNIQL